MAIEAYWGSRSPYSSRVLLALALKQIPYESKRLSFSEQDLRSSHFLAINPRGQVPAIRDGAFTLNESIAILCYLEAKHPERPLFGGTPIEQGLIWRAIMECVYYLEPHMTHFAGTICSGELEEKRQEVIQSRETIELELTRINDMLSHDGYLVGHRISAADVVLYPVVKLLVSTAQKENTEAVSGKLRKIKEHFPAIHAWCQKIEEIPGFERTSL